MDMDWIIAILCLAIILGGLVIAGVIGFKAIKGIMSIIKDVQKKIEPVKQDVNTISEEVNKLTTTQKALTAGIKHTTNGMKETTTLGKRIPKEYKDVVSAETAEAYPKYNP